MEELMAYMLLIFALVTVFLLGRISAFPNELENGCIIHDGKVYCEKVNKEDN